MALEAFFLPTQSGRCFCLFHSADFSPNPKGAILYISPFAEEMNCARRVAAAQARAFAAEGFAVLQIDLFGCGDSDGGFSEASWAGWCDDLSGAIDWLRRRVEAPLWFWGLRAGCLLAAEVSRRIDQPLNFVFWQPSTAGNRVLRQFLRLKLAGELISGQTQTTVDDMIAELDAGQTVEVAGYSISPALAKGLAVATLEPPGQIGHLIVIETHSANVPTGLTSVTEKSLVSWQQRAQHTKILTLRSPAFWQRVDRVDTSALIAATSAALRDAVR